MLARSRRHFISADILSAPTFYQRRRQLSAEFRVPRTLPLGPASGDGRGDMSQIRRSAAILATCVTVILRRRVAQQRRQFAVVRAPRRRQESLGGSARLRPGRRGLARAVHPDDRLRPAPANRPPLYGYARVSTLDQDLTIHRKAPKAAGSEVLPARLASDTGHADAIAPQRIR
jgi:hypothetical protein